MVKVKAYLEVESSPIGAVKCAQEFYYLRGRVDIISLTGSGQVVAFEGKLTRWRDALRQAYRNLCFAHQSFVVLPAAAADKAMAYEREFLALGVGLCAVTANTLEVRIPAQPSTPLQPWLTQRAAEMALSA